MRTRSTFLLLLCFLWPFQAQALRVGLLLQDQNPLQEGSAAVFFGRLEETLQEPVERRWFTSQDNLLAWLEDHQELDLVLLPASAVGPRKTLGPQFPVDAGPSWAWVSRAYLDSATRQRLAQALRAASSSSLLPVKDPAGLPTNSERGAASVAADNQAAPAMAAGRTFPPGSSPKISGGALDQLQSQPVEIEADRLQFDQQSGTYQADGSVSVRSGPVTLHSESIRVNPQTTEAVAEGAVRISSPEGDVEGESLRLNLKSGLGSLEKGTILIRRQNFHVAGEEIEKIDQKTYRLSRGSFTTCAGDRPDWHFSARDLEVTIDGYAKGHDAVFYLRDIPVFYTPYMIYPVKRGRESGFLMPSVGFSERRGNQVSIPFYWAIARNQDATFYLDWLSDLGLGKGAEYRYVFGDDNVGDADLYHINGVKGAENRFAYRWKHDGTLPDQWRLKADVEYVSSRDYWEDFGKVAGEYNKDEVESTVSASRNWRKLNLTTQIKYTKDLQKNNDLTLQRLPEIRLEALHQRLGTTPVYAEFSGSSTYFWRREGLKGERLLGRPVLSAVWQPSDMVEVQPEIGYTRSHYWTSHQGPGYEDDGIWDFRTRVSTSLYRTFSTQGKLVSRVRHSIEPELVYTFVPDEDQSHLPEFDSLDRIPAVNTLSYGLTNRLVAKLESPGGDPVYHEFLFLRLSQEFDIKESRSDLLDPGDSRHPFSPLRSELILRPTRTSLLDIDARYDPNRDSRGFTAFNVTGRYEDGQDNALQLDYRYREGEVDYAQGEVDLALLKPVYVNYLHRYALSGTKNLEKVLKLEYRSQCWSLYLTYRDRLDDTEYLFSFALSGLAPVSKFGNSLTEKTPAQQ